jgi:hypothetical protein
MLPVLGGFPEILHMKPVHSLSPGLPESGSCSVTASHTIINYSFKLLLLFYTLGSLKILCHCNFITCINVWQRRDSASPHRSTGRVGRMKSNGGKLSKLQKNR